MEDMQSQESVAQPAWHAIVHQTMKKAGVTLGLYVPDNVLAPLLNSLHADRDFTMICTTREEEAVGVAVGAWLGGKLAVVMMQTSGFATLPNALASLVLPFQIPVIMLISERGTLGEFNPGQATVCKTMRPSLESLGIEHYTLSRLDEVEFIVERCIRQAVSTQSPVALILNPLLTARKPEEKKH